MESGEQTTGKTARHPAEDAVEFWTKEASRTADALDASRRETADLERHYRAALVQIKGLQRQVRLLVDERAEARREGIEAAAVKADEALRTYAARQADEPRQSAEWIAATEAKTAAYYIAAAIRALLEDRADG